MGVELVIPELHRGHTRCPLGGAAASFQARSQESCTEVLEPRPLASLIQHISVALCSPTSGGGWLMS